MRVLLVTSVFFGLAFGVYELVLPLYLLDIEISLAGLGMIFAFAEVVVFFLRVYSGRLSDIFGRKMFYSLALLFCSISNGGIPLSASVGFQSVLKVIRESTVYIRNTMHSLLIYDEAKERFMSFLGRTRGGEFVFQGFGALCVAWLMGSGGGGSYLITFLFSGMMLLAGCLFFSLVYREKGGVRRGKSSGGFGIPLAMPRALVFLTVFGFLFEVGLSISHAYAIPLFFRGKFGASWGQIALISAFHRFTLGIPLFIIGPLLKNRLRALFSIFVVVEGGVLCISALIPHFFLSAVVWMLHDLAGAGVWLPIYGQFLQRYARPERRGEDVAKATSLSQLGRIFGPLICGFLMSAFETPAVQVSSAFFVSGLVVMISPLCLVGLRGRPLG